jgi:hypothetical protein
MSIGSVRIHRSSYDNWSCYHLPQILGTNVDSCLILPKMVARAFLSVIPLSWKNARVVFSCSEHPLQINLFSFGFSGATSRIAVFGVGSATGGGGNTWGSVAVDVVTVARRGKATVRNCCIKFNRIRHPYRRGVHPTLEGHLPRL